MVIDMSVYILLMKVPTGSSCETWDRYETKKEKLWTILI